METEKLVVCAILVFILSLIGMAVIDSYLYRRAYLECVSIMKDKAATEIAVVCKK